MKIICKNCGNSYEGQFCNECGQKAQTSAINFKYVLNEIGSSVFQLEKGLFYTIKELFIRPGHSIREYLEGKRVKHFRPISFLFLTSTIYALVAYYFDLQTVASDMVDGMIGGLTDDYNDPVAATSNTLIFMKWLVAHPAYFALFLFPLFSLASYITFIKSGYNYFEHLILNAYLTGQQAIVYMIFLPIVHMVGETYLVAVIELACATSLTFWTYITFFKGYSVLSKVLLTILTYVLYFVSFTLLIFAMGRG